MNKEAALNDQFLYHHKNVNVVIETHNVCVSSYMQRKYVEEV